MKQILFISTFIFWALIGYAQQDTVHIYMEDFPVNSVIYGDDPLYGVPDTSFAVAENVVVMFHLNSNADLMDMYTWTINDENSLEDYMYSIEGGTKLYITKDSVTYHAVDIDEYGVSGDPYDTAAGFWQTDYIQNHVYYSFFCNDTNINPITQIFNMYFYDPADVLVAPFESDILPICGSSTTLATNNYVNGLAYYWYKNGELFSSSSYPLDSGSVTISEAGQYILKIVSPYETLMDTVNVNIVTNDIPDLGPDTTYCNAEFTRILDIQNHVYDSYLWSTGETTSSITIDTGGVYTVAATNACGTFTGTITIEDWHYPELNLPPYIDACEGEEVVLDAGFEYTTIVWGNAADTSLLQEGGVLTVEEDVTVWLLVDKGSCPALDDFTTVSFIKPYQDPKLCITTVDSTGKIFIAWEKPDDVYDVMGLNYYMTTEYFKIYKDSSGVFVPIGTVDRDSAARFVDVNSQPNVNVERYKVAIVDTCGNESPLSYYHQTMLLSVNFGQVNNEPSNNLMWTDYKDKSGEFVPALYQVFRKTPDMSDFEIIKSVGYGTNNYNDINPPEGAEYIIGVGLPYTCEIAPNIISVPQMRGVHDISMAYSNRANNGTSGLAYLEQPSNKVYPNPSKGIFNLQEAVAHILITDVYGRKVLELENSSTIDLSSLASGVYFAKINRSQTIKLIKQ